MLRNFQDAFFIPDDHSGGARAASKQQDKVRQSAQQLRELVQNLPMINVCREAAINLGMIDVLSLLENVEVLLKNPPKNLVTESLIQKLKLLDTQARKIIRSRGMRETKRASPPRAPEWISKSHSAMHHSPQKLELKQALESELLYRERRQDVKTAVSNQRKSRYLHQIAEKAKASNMKAMKVYQSQKENQIDRINQYKPFTADSQVSKRIKITRHASVEHITANSSSTGVLKPQTVFLPAQNGFKFRSIDQIKVCSIKSGLQSRFNSLHVVEESGKASKLRRKRIAEPFNSLFLTSADSENSNRKVVSEKTNTVKNSLHERNLVRTAYNKRRRERIQAEKTQQDLQRAHTSAQRIWEISQKKQVRERRPLQAASPNKKEQGNSDWIDDRHAESNRKQIMEERVKRVRQNLNRFERRKRALEQDVPEDFEDQIIKLKSLTKKQSNSDQEITILRSFERQQEKMRIREQISHIHSLSTAALKQKLESLFD